MSDIFREVDEEVRRDQAVQFWQKNQNYVIVFAIMVIAATAAWKAYTTYQTRAAEAAGSRFEAALQLMRDGKIAEAKTALVAVATDAPAGYRLLANFAEASVAAAEAGVSAYDALASDAATPALMQTVAQLRAAILRLDDAGLDELKRRLEPLAEPGRPFRNSARELLGYAALRVNDFDLAARQFDQIVVDPLATAAQRQRAEAMLGVVQSGKAHKSP